MYASSALKRILGILNLVTFDVNNLLELVLGTDKVQPYLNFVLADYVQDLKQRLNHIFVELETHIANIDEKICTIL